MTDVTIYEVGPRDGLQNEAGVVPTATKIEFIRRLVAAGLPMVEATEEQRAEIRRALEAQGLLAASAA